MRGQVALLSVHLLIGGRSSTSCDETRVHWGDWCQRKTIRLVAWDGSNTFHRHGEVCSALFRAARGEEAAGEGNVPEDKDHVQTGGNVQDQLLKGIT